MKVRSSSSAGRSNNEKFRRTASRDMLGSIAEAPSVSPTVNDTPTAASDDDDEDIDFQVRPLERRDRSFLNSSVRKSPTGSSRGNRSLSLSEHSSSSTSSIRSFDQTKRESSLLTPQKLGHDEDEAKQENGGSSSFKTRHLKKKQDDLAHILSHLVVIEPKRSHSMVDQIRRKSSLREEEPTSDTKTTTFAECGTSRRSRSFVEQSSNLRKQWFQKSKSQVQALLRSSNIKTPLEVDRRPSLTPRRDSRVVSSKTTSTTADSFMKNLYASSGDSCASTVTSSPSSSSRTSRTIKASTLDDNDSLKSDWSKDSDSDVPAASIKTRFSNDPYASNSQPRSNGNTFSSSKSRSFGGRKSAKISKQQKLREEMKRFLESEGSIKEEEEEEEDEDEEDESVYDSSVGAGGSVGDSEHVPGPRRVLSRIQSVSRPDSSESSIGSQRDSGPRRTLSRIKSIAKSDSSGSASSGRGLSRLHSITKSDSSESASSRDVPSRLNSLTRTNSSESSSIRTPPSRVLSITKSDSSGSGSNRRGRRGRSVDGGIDNTIAGITGIATPTTSNRKKAAQKSPTKTTRSSAKMPSMPAKPSSSSCELSISDSGSISSTSQHSLRPSLSNMMRSSPLSRRTASKVAVDMAGSLQGSVEPIGHKSVTESPTVSSGSSFLRRIGHSFSGKEDRRRVSAPSLPVATGSAALFDEAFYSSSHHRRTMASQRTLIWTTDRNDNFSDWILLIVRSGVSWETSNVDTYHIHKSVVGVGPRPSLFLLDEFEDHDSVFVRNTSSVELMSQAADLVPTMLDYMYNMKGDPLQITTSTATALRHLADKFGVETMFQEVNDFIRRDLNESTVYTYSNHAALFKDKQLMQAAFRLQKSLDLM